MFTNWEVESGQTGDSIAPMEPREEGRVREFDWDEAMATREFLGQALTAVHDAREDQGEALDELRDAMDWIENHPEMSEDEDLSLDSNGGA
jgi:hypothetical protein